MRAYQSLLFVPGSRPERFEKALASGADIVTIDLEDAVGPADKDSARAAALAALSDPRLGIRVNGLRTPQGLADLLAIAEAEQRPPFIMIPMVEAAAELEIAHAILPEVALLPLVETVRGLDAVAAVAAMPGIGGVMLGGADFCGEMGVPMSWDALLSARYRIVQACTAARVPAIDVPWLGLDDLDGLAAELVRIRAMGFAAKSVVHPKHIEPVHAAFRPSEQEVADATEAERVYLEAGEAAVRWRGQMLEAPVMARYRRILELSRALNSA